MTERRTDEETLSRWLDGELDEAEAKRVEAALAEDAGDRARSDALAAQDEALRNWFEARLEPAPRSLEDTVRAGFAARRARTSHRRARWWLPAAAAAAVVAVGILGFDRLIDNRVGAALDKLRAERVSDIAFMTAAMQKVLESRPSGVKVSLSNPETGLGVVLQPRRTWKSASGHWCREFVEIFPGAEQKNPPVSVACRTGKGAWYRVRTELLSPTEPVLPHRTGGTNL